MRSILIIGGAGFLGSHLAARFAAQGDDVHVLVRARTDCSRLAGLKVTRHVVSLTERAGVAACLDAVRPAEVYYLATNTRRPPDPLGCDDAVASVGEDLAPWVSFLDAIARMAEPPAVVVRSGSVAEYGAGPVPYDEAQREAPLNSYSASLLAGTHYAQMLQRRIATRLVTARLSLIYGPGQSSSFLIAQMIGSLLEGRPVTLRHPEHRRDLLYVDDAVEGLVRLAGPQVPGGSIVNVASGRSHAVQDVAAEIRRQTGASPQLVRAMKDAPTPADAIPDLVASNARLRRLTDWAPRVELADGLSRTIGVSTALHGKVA